MPRVVGCTATDQKNKILGLAHPPVIGIFVVPVLRESRLHAVEDSGLLSVITGFFYDADLRRLLLL